MSDQGLDKTKQRRPKGILAATKAGSLSHDKQVVIEDAARIGYDWKAALEAHSAAGANDRLAALLAYKGAVKHIDRVEFERFKERERLGLAKMASSKSKCSKRGAQATKEWRDSQAAKETPATPWG